MCEDFGVVVELQVSHAGRIVFVEAGAEVADVIAQCW
jgi:hypothetical protein